jgi:hypothetical protein
MKMNDWGMGWNPKHLQRCLSGMLRKISLDIRTGSSFNPSRKRNALILLRNHGHSDIFPCQIDEVLSHSISEEKEVKAHPFFHPERKC